MKNKILSLVIVITLVLGTVFIFTSCDLVLPGGNPGETPGGKPVDTSDYTIKGGISEHVHTDANKDKVCDDCKKSTSVFELNLFAVNDLHGKFCDTDSQIGVDEMATYIENQTGNVVILSSGDMWQGSAESNMTKGGIITDWMNSLGFASMTLGNHEFDWGIDQIKANAEKANFPFLAINIYDKATNKQVDYAKSSVMVERGGVKIGIIGAIGNCHSSILQDHVKNVEFKVGAQLAALVKAESDKLRQDGANIIIYSIHDGGEGSGDVSHYDTSLSSGGYVDVVFEAHTHQKYSFRDTYGTWHIQSGGDNNTGMSHARILYNLDTKKVSTVNADIVLSNSYKNLKDDEDTEKIETKYAEIIHYAYNVSLGTNSQERSSSYLTDLVAELYLEAAEKKWTDKDIALGGGYLKTRSPYKLATGKITYASLMSILPFDNQIVLCKVSGSTMARVFINTTNSDYHVAYSNPDIKANYDSSAEYYIVTDTYTSSYQGLDVVEYYDQTTFARDLVKEYAIAGNFGTGVNPDTVVPPGTSSGGNDGENSGTENGGDNGETENGDSYTITSIADVLSIGESLAAGGTSTETYYIKGEITEITQTYYGNMYIEDETGSIYIYGLNDVDGTKYGSMTTKPEVGDTIVVKSTVYKYVNGDSVTIELKGAVLVEIL